MDWKKLFARKNIWLLLLAAVQITVLGGRFAKDFRTGPVLEVPPAMFDSYGSDTAWTDGGGVHVEDHTGDFGTTRWLDLPAGSYQVVVNYVNTGGPGTVTMVDDIMPTARHDRAFLPASLTQVVFSLWLPHPCATAQFHFGANDGRMSVTSLQVIPTHSMAYVHFLTVLVLFLVLDAALLLWRGILPAPPVSARTSALLIAGMVLFACLPLGMDPLAAGHDFGFHLARIEGIKSGLLAGQFPVRVAPALLGGKGYASGLMYGDILLYPLAVLRILGFDLQAVYRLYVIAVTAATAIVTRHVLRRMLGGNEIPALGGTALYLFSLYRLTNIYIRAAVGEYTAMLFLPLVVYGFWRLYTQEPGERPAAWCWVPLAVGFSGLLQTHMLSTVMVTVLAVVFCLAMARRTFTRPVLVPILKAAAATVAWNLWFLVPFLQMYLGKALRVCVHPTDASLLAGTSLPLNQMLLMQVPQGNGSENLSSYLVSRMGLSVGAALAAGGLVLLLALADPALRAADRRLARTGIAALVMAGLSLWMASNLFPWHDIYLDFPTLSRLSGSLQFAWRFLSPATALLVFAAACGLGLFAKARPALARELLAVLVVLALLPAGQLMSEVITDRERMPAYSLGGLENASLQVGGGEYLPAAVSEDVELDKLKSMPIFPEGATVLDTSRSGDGYILTLQNDSEEPVTGTLPLLAYPGYHIAAGGGDGVALGEADGLVTLTVPDEWAGTVTVDWTTPPLWRAGDIGSLLAVAGTLLVWRRGRRAGQKR